MLFSCNRIHPSANLPLIAEREQNASLVTVLPMTTTSTLIRHTCVLVMLAGGAAPAAAQIAAIVNNSGFAVGAPVAPGSIAAMFGTFAGVATAETPSTTWPNTLSGVRVFVNDVEARLHYVSASQINFLIPQATAPGRANVRVSIGSVEHRGTVLVLESAPGLSDVPGTRPVRQAAAHNQDGSTNGPSNRARRGEVIQLFGTGLGPVQGNVQDGVPPGNALPLTRAPQAYISGVEAAVQFSGLHSLFPGLYQINLVIPNRPFITGEVPVVLVTGGVDSNTASIWVE
jgi:uncharacterized protein (TIGR03437 family)